MRKKKAAVGSSFDDYLKEEGLYEEVTARAIKRVIARQLGSLMQAEGLTKSELAKRMQTSRAQLDRLLDPDNESVTLGTLAKAAQANRAPARVGMATAKGRVQGAWCPLSKRGASASQAKGKAASKPSKADRGVATGVVKAAGADRESWPAGGTLESAGARNKAPLR